MVISHAPMVVVVLGLAAAACVSEAEKVQAISEREHRECLARGFHIESRTYATCRRLMAERRARAEDRYRGNILMTR